MLSSAKPRNHPALAARQEDGGERRPRCIGSSQTPFEALAALIHSLDLMILASNSFLLLLVRHLLLEAMHLFLVAYCF